MMKQKYESPEIEITLFSSDVITTSGADFDEDEI